MTSKEKQNSGDRNREAIKTIIALALLQNLKNIIKHLDV